MVASIAFIIFVATSTAASTAAAAPAVTSQPAPAATAATTAAAWRVCAPQRSLSICGPHGVLELAVLLAPFWVEGRLRRFSSTSGGGAPPVTTSATPTPLLPPSGGRTPSGDLSSTSVEGALARGVKGAALLLGAADRHVLADAIDGERPPAVATGREPGSGARKRRWSLLLLPGRHSYAGPWRVTAAAAAAHPPDACRLFRCPLDASSSEGIVSARCRSAAAPRGGRTVEAGSGTAGSHPGLG